MNSDFNKFCDFVSNLLKPHDLTLEIESGSKYHKLISNRGGSRSVWCFVDKTSGEIFKPAGWKSPAKHTRGSVSNIESYTGYSWTGPHYLASGRKAA